MLMSMGKGRRKQLQCFTHLIMEPFVFQSILGGKQSLEHTGKYCSRLSISKYIGSQGNALPRSSQV